jgi:hypothetical protein
MKLVSLLVLAVAAGVAWRLELEIRGGWAALTWIGYTHWAVPAGVVAFVIWVLAFTPTPQPKRFAAMLLTFGLVNCLVVEVAFRAIFGGFGLMSIVGQSPLGDWLLLLLISPWGSAALWAGYPLIFGVICRWFAVPVRIWATLVSAVLFSASWPLAIFVRSFFDERGDDAIHALKSGHVIPFLVVSLGLPIVFLPNSGEAAEQRPLSK